RHLGGLSRRGRTAARHPCGVGSGRKRRAGLPGRSGRPSPDRAEARGTQCSAAIQYSGREAMIEAAMIWNEPNNKSHWDIELDPDWAHFAEMATCAADAIRKANPDITIVLGGISPIDPMFIRNMQSRGVLDHVDAIAV